MRQATSVLVLALLLIAAGCSGVSTAPDGSATERAGSPTLAAEADRPLPAVEQPASVTAVVDGDTIRVEYDDGSTDTVRLVGVDTPEVQADNDPTEFEGVPDTDAGETCLRSAGTNATAFTERHLLDREVGLAVDPNTDRRDYYDRLLAYVVVDDRLFNYGLVTTGHARVYDGPFSRAENFYAAETRARDDRRGLWRCVEGTVAADGGTTTAVDTGLAVAEFNYDAAGNDNENLNDEYVVFENRGEEPLALDGWTVADEAGHTYTFDEFVLDPGATVTLRTGSGTDSDTDRYWGQTQGVWNNDGDTVVVRNAAGDVVLRRSY